MYNRISIVGGSGTGKTTLARKLGEVLNLPVVYIDAIQHKPNWEARPKEERDKMILEEVAKEKWIIEGTYRATLKPRFEKSNLIIWLDYSTFTQVKGVIKRYLTNSGKEKAEIPGCKEKLDFGFLLLVMKYRRTKRHYVEEALEEINPSNILVFEKQKSLDKLIEDICNYIK